MKNHVRTVSRLSRVPASAFIGPFDPCDHDERLIMRFMCFVNEIAGKMVFGSRGGCPPGVMC